MPTVRQVRFDWPDPLPVVWTPQPELALTANAVSMLMPHAEPYVVDAVAGALDELPDDDPLVGRGRAFVRQERQHHAQHHRFNQLLLRQAPGLRRVERLMAWVFALLRRRTSPAFGLAFAAGFETVAYAAARWTAKRSSTLFLGADRQMLDLFLWHLAEEVEHKSVAHDVNARLGGGRVRYAAAMVTSMVLLAGFTVLGTMVLLWRTRRILNPLAHLRMLVWSISFLFDLLPAMLLSTFRSHHPDRLVDPAFYEVWLQEHDLGRGDGEERGSGDPEGGYGSRP